MSANNQILIKKHNSKYYVFDDVMAESWSDKNELSREEASGCFLTEEAAMKKASDIMKNLEYPEEREYGIQIDKLAKDGADINIK